MFVVANKIKRDLTILFSSKICISEELFNNQFLHLLGVACLQHV